MRWGGNNAPASSEKKEGGEVGRVDDLTGSAIRWAMEIYQKDRGYRKEWNQGYSESTAPHRTGRGKDDLRIGEAHKDSKSLHNLSSCLIKRLAMTNTGRRRGLTKILGCRRSGLWD